MNSRSSSVELGAIAPRREHDRLDVLAFAVDQRAVEVEQECVGRDNDAEVPAAEVAAVEAAAAAEVAAAVNVVELSASTSWPPSSPSLSPWSPSLSCESVSPGSCADASTASGWSLMVSALPIGAPDGCTTMIIGGGIIMCMNDDDQHHVQHHAHRARVVHRVRIVDRAARIAAAAPSAASSGARPAASARFSSTVASGSAARSAASRRPTNDWNCMRAVVEQSGVLRQRLDARAVGVRRLARLRGSRSP